MGVGLCVGRCVGVGLGVGRSLCVGVAVAALRGTLGGVGDGALAAWLDVSFGVAVALGDVGVLDGVVVGAARCVGVDVACGVREGEVVFGTTTSGAVAPGGFTIKRPPEPSSVLACGSTALDPMITTLAVAAVVNPTSIATTMTVLVERAANADDVAEDMVDSRCVSAPSLIAAHLP